MIVTILPDCIFCGDAKYSDSKLIFSPECIKIGCLDSHGRNTTFFSEWATENLINIDCLWSQNVSFNFNSHYTAFFYACMILLHLVNLLHFPG